MAGPVSGVRVHAERAAGDGPVLGPLVIYLGWRALRDARAYNIKGMPRILAVGAITMGLLCIVSLWMWLDLLLSIRR